MVSILNSYSFFSSVACRIQNLCNRNFFYDVLETLEIDLLAWKTVPLEAVSGPLPKRRYACLEACQRRGILFRYTPFDQGALADNLNPDWHGACNILSFSWLRRKLESENILSPATYRINDSHLPHPMIVGDNRNAGPDVQEIREELRSSLGEPIFKTQSKIESQFDQTKVKALLAYFKSHASLYALVGSYALNTLPALLIPSPRIAHACAFVKEGDQCAWFDANHGEVAFAHFDDFAHWFKKETARGVLSFIFQTNQLSKKNCWISQVYDHPRFTEEGKNAHSLAKRLTQKRNKATDFKIASILDYTLECYTPSTSMAPKRKTIKSR